MERVKGVPAAMGLVNHGSGQQHRVRYSYLAAGVLVKVLTGTNLKKGRGKRSVINHVTSIVADGDAISDGEVIRSSFEQPTQEAHDVLLAANGDG